MIILVSNAAKPLRVLLFIVGTILAKGTIAPATKDKLNERAAMSTSTDSEMAEMFSDKKIRYAAVAFEPLVLFKIVSSTEIASGTRSARTIYKIKVLATSSGKIEEGESVWKWGHGWQMDGLHLSFLRHGSFSNSMVFPNDSEAVALEIFSTLNSKLNEYKNKFMKHEAYVLACKGKGQIVVLKVLPRENGVPRKKVKVEVVRNLNGERQGEVSVSTIGIEELEDNGQYFAYLKKSLFGIEASMWRKASIEDVDSLCDLYKSRLEFLKFNWAEKYAQP